MVKQLYCGKQVKPSSSILMALCNNFLKTAFNLLVREVLLKVIKIDGILRKHLRQMPQLCDFTLMVSSEHANFIIP